MAPTPRIQTSLNVTLSDNLGKIRTGKGISRRTLADRLDAGGRRLPETSIRRIEVGARPMDVDDLIDIAIALEITPVDLLVPGSWPDTAPWPANDQLTMSARHARAWIGGHALLHPPASASQLAEIIRWMPEQRAREVAKTWSARSK